MEGGVSCTIWWGFLCRVLAVLPVPHFWLSTMLSTYRVKLKVKTQVNRKCDRTTSRAAVRLRYRRGSRGSFALRGHAGRPERWDQPWSSELTGARSAGRATTSVTVSLYSQLFRSPSPRSLHRQDHRLAVRLRRSRSRDKA